MNRRKFFGLIAGAVAAVSLGLKSRDAEFWDDFSGHFYHIEDRLAPRYKIANNKLVRIDLWDRTIYRPNAAWISAGKPDWPLHE